MEQMANRLYEASMMGDVERLNALIDEDALILERCRTITSYGESPLHIVSMLGHQVFCLELVRRNPGLVFEVDSRRSTALHLASYRGHINIVRTLLAVWPEDNRVAMCKAYDGEGYTPVHLAAMKGRVDVLRELVNVCPDAVWAEVRASQGGNVLHLCINYYQTEALRFLVELQNGQHHLNSVDTHGNSILHLAVAEKQVEIVEYLVSQPSIEVNKKNCNDLTALDLLRLQPKRDSKSMEIAHFLQLSLGQTLSGFSREINSRKGNEQLLLLDKQRNSIMVVASLIAAMAFQAGVNPPSGFTPATELYTNFVISNTIGFLSSLSVILLLISGLPLRHKVFLRTWTAIMWVSITSTTCTYTISLASISDWKTYSVGFRIVIAAWFDLTALLFLVHTIRILSRRIQDWPFRNKFCSWISIVTMWIVAVLLERPMPPIYSIYRHIPYAILFTGFMVLSAFLTLLYAIQLVSFIRENSKSLFNGFRLHMFSCIHARAV